MVSINQAFIQTAVVLMVATTYAEGNKAIAVLTGQAPGNVTFTERKDGTIAIKGIITNLTPGKHGFHIHEKGDISNGCMSMQGHFNPYRKDHGGPTDDNRHVGDLGNIVAQDNGVAEFEFTDKVIALSGPKSILGRGVVVHSDADDLGKGGFTDSLTTGHAGTRLSCGVIGVIEHLPNSANAMASPMLLIFTMMGILLAQVFNQKTS